MTCPTSRAASRPIAETDESRAIADDARTEFMEFGRTPVTTKSKANALAKL